MSAVLTPERTWYPAILGQWWEAWRQMGPRHLAALALSSLLMAIVDWTVLIDKLDKPGVPTVMAFDAGVAVVLFGLTLLAWVAAVHQAPAGGPERTRRLVWAVIVSATLSAAIIVPVMYWLKMPELWSNLMGKTKPIPPLSLVLVANIVHFALYCVLFITVGEVLKRRALTNSAIRAAQREQTEIAREVLESRLAAMQAQVEPQFLFNSLVDIESLYRKDPQRAADDLDRLITYLRVALPRLREPGSSIEAEIELVQAYLAVVTSLHAGRPALTVTLGEDCRSARFYPMLLLPLVQRAVRRPAGGLPDSIRIGVQRAGEDVAIVTRIAGGGGCAEDFELARVRERLQGLYGTRASLDCAELDQNTTQFIMRIPADGGTA
jgi:hypothetical protein